MLVTLAASLLAACGHVSANESNSPNEAPTAGDPALPQAHELMSRMVGRWVLTGTIAGQNTTHDVDAEWVLQGKYVRIDEVSRQRGDDGRPLYEATVYVGRLNGRYVCLWLDNTEVASGEVTCSAAPASDAIPFEFRSADGGLMITNTFSYDRAADTWAWSLDNISDGRATPFGRVTLRRQ
jgi:hypothetical protein